MTDRNTRIAFYTLGCKLNQFESEAIADSFISAGAEVVPVSDFADIYVINTCTVTSKSEQKARRVIRKLAGNFPDSLVVVTGCYAQLEKDEIESLAGNIAIVPQEKKHLLVKAAACIENSGVPLSFAAEIIKIGNKDIEPDKSGGSSFYPVKKGYTFHSRAFLKIQDGCNNFCRYCRVPLARGRSRSLDKDEIIGQVKEISAAGYKELVLTGVNISSYKSGNYGLVSLVENILDETENIRIRLSSLEPDSLDSEYKRLAENERICPHFHIPVQSGSDQILLSMGRKYLSEKIYDAAEILRSGGRNPLISADIITGLPGETDKDFDDTLELVKKAGFAYLHVFPYSKREGTAAFFMKNHVPERVSRIRAEKLRIKSEKLFAAYAREWEGKNVEALVENPGTDKETWNSVSGNYLKLHVKGLPAGADLSGSLAVCRILNHRKEEGNSFDAVYTGSAGQ